MVHTREIVSERLTETGLLSFLPRQVYLPRIDATYRTNSMHRLHWEWRAICMMATKLNPLFWEFDQEEARAYPASWLLLSLSPWDFLELHQLCCWHSTVGPLGAYPPWEEGSGSGELLTLPHPITQSFPFPALCWLGCAGCQSAPHCDGMQLSSCCTGVSSSQQERSSPNSGTIFALVAHSGTLAFAGVKIGPWFL